MSFNDTINNNIRTPNNTPVDGNSSAGDDVPRPRGNESGSEYGGRGRCLRYWMLTIPHHLFMPYLPPGVKYIRGQLEVGGNSGYYHWQILVIFGRTVRLGSVKKIFGQSVHAEPTRSEASCQYVWKEDTRVEGTQFELGEKPRDTKYNKKDWDDILEHAKKGKFEEISPDVQIRYFPNLLKVASYYSNPQAVVKEVYVFWGSTGTGKSRRAWAEASLQAYPKIPTTKFWDGYRQHSNVVIDEFDGKVGITHMLSWLDRYPVIVEIKGGSVSLACEKIWITSNVDPRNWYNDSNSSEEQRKALMRRFTLCVHFENFL